MTTGILIIHTPAQLDDASMLVDLLEASLALPAGAIACSSLPGYAWANGAASLSDSMLRFSEALDSAHAAIALVDGRALGDAQLWFDVAAAWARGKRVAVLADRAERRSQLPVQLDAGEVIERLDRDALVGLVEDLAFQLGLRPRIGHDAQRALDQLSSAPPPFAAGPLVEPASEPPATADAVTAVGVYDSLESVPPPPALPSELLEQAAAPQSAPPQSTPPQSAPPQSAPPQSTPPQSLLALPVADEDDHGDAYELSDHEFECEPLFEPEIAPISCQLSLEAGRTISDCSFHRQEGGNLVAELERSFGCFIDAVGGNWLELQRIGDVDVWLAATDNLLESLPPHRRYIAEWYEVGFQFAALHNIAAQGVPSDPEQYALFKDAWDRSLEAFLRSAESARIAAREVRRQQALLENLIGPEQRRDYGNITRSLEELRALAGSADRG